MRPCDSPILRNLKALDDKEPLVIYSLLLVFETDIRLVQRWQQKDNDPESRAPSSPQTPIKDIPPFFPSSSAPGSSLGNSTSVPPTSTPQRQPLSLETSGSPDDSRKRLGEPQGTPEGAKKPRIGEDDTVANESLFVAKAYGTPDKAVAEACKVRDKACILTGCTREISEPCHLFPFSMNDWHTHRWEEFLEGLRMFWCDKRVNEWCKAIYGDVSGTEKLQNQILLSPNAHMLHTAGWFTLEPIDEDKVHGMWLKLRFWWLKRHDHQEGVKFGVRPQLPQDLCPKEYGVALHRIDNARPLVSGEEIKLETHNPQTHPLPDTRLLELQWMLNRVLALRGAAEPEDLEDESDVDSDEGLEYFARPVL